MPDWLFYALSLSLVVLFALALRQLPELWREGLWVWDYDRPEEWWGLGLPLWRGIIRMAIPGFVAVLPFIAVALVWTAFPEGSTMYYVLGYVGCAGLLLLAYIEGGIVLFNRPRALVPPPYRDRPGAVAEWRERRSGPA